MHDGKFFDDQSGNRVRDSVVTSFCKALRLWLLLFLCCASTHAIAAPVVLDGPRISLFKHAEFLFDDNQLSIDDIMRPENDARFMPFQHGRLLFGHDAVWIKLVVQPVAAAVTPQEWWLEVAPASIDEVTFYQPMPNGLMHVSWAGKVLPFAMREVAYRHPIFRMMLTDDGPQVIYIKARSNFNGVRQLILWQPALFQERANQAQLAWGIFLGVCSLLIIASLWFERAVKDGVYRYFAAYVFSSSLIMLANTGLFYQYAVQWSPALLRLPLAMWFSLLGNVVGIAFFFKFTGMHDIKPQLSRWYLSIVSIVAMLLAFGLMTDYAALVRTIMMVCVSLVFMPCTIILLWKPVLQSDSEVRFAFFVSGLLLSVTIILGFFINSGLVMPNSLMEHQTFVMMLLFFLVIYYAISKRYKRMREDKDAAQLKMVDMVRDSERGLEIQVAEKTQDLRLAMEDVEKALQQERAVYEEQKNFIAMVSHELRTPLAVIDAAAHNMMRESWHGVYPMQSNLAIIQKATERLSLLVSDQLDQSSMEVISGGIQSQSIPLLPLFNDLIAEMKPLSSRHHIAVAPHLPLVIYTDAALIHLVLRAVMDEIMGSTPYGTVITLSAQQLQEHWHIDLSDDGVEPIDLTVAKQLMDALGGSISHIEQAAASRTIRVTLPKGPQ